MAEYVFSDYRSNNDPVSKQSSDVLSCEDSKTDKAMERPLLLEDFRRNFIPPSLKNLLKYFDKQNIELSKSEFLVGCIYLLMLEYGFIPQEKGHNYEDCGFNYSRIQELSAFPEWKKRKDNSYVYFFILPPYSLYSCKVVCFKMGDDLIINAVVKNIEDACYTIMFDILSYFTDGAYTKVDLKKVQNLKILSSSFKNKIAFPIKHTIMRLNSLRHPCFEDLPLEIIFIIFKYTSGIDIIKLTSTSKHLRSIRLEPKFWENLLFRDYNITAPKNQTYDKLMQLYRNMYKSHGKSQPIKIGR